MQNCSKRASRPRFGSDKKKAEKAAQEMTREARVARIKRKLSLEEEEENVDDPQYGAGMF